MPARRGGVRVGSWWARAWLRAVEEAAYAEADLRAGRALARGGSVGALTVAPGSVVAAVIEGDDAWPVSVAVPQLPRESVAAFVELVAAESGRIAELLAGDLPHSLVEHAEEAGVELLPYGGELATECGCQAWTQPCRHAVAVLTQVGWLVDGDPLVLVLLRGLPREDLLSALHARESQRAPAADAGLPPDEAADLEVAYDAAVRAARLLEVVARAEAEGRDPDVDHLL
jgi:uncharacterized Zn finger protein